MVKTLPSDKHEPVKVTVLGAGAFGTAMATIAARQGHEVVIYCRDAEQAESINVKRCNNRYLSEFTLLPNIRATLSVADAMKSAALVIHCLPAQLTPEFLKLHRDALPLDAILCITSKGLYLPTKQLLSVPILEALDDRPTEQPLAFLSGPSFAVELMQQMPSAVVVASTKLYHAVAVQRILSSVDFRIYTSQDIVGVQLGGALKNPLAIGAGMVEGANMGINTLAAYVTRSCLELQKLCVAMGGDPATISGLAGIGDLMLTAFGALSRNRRCGTRFMQGEPLETILKDYTVEGVPTAEVAVHFIEQCGLDLPIFQAVDAALKGNVTTDKLQMLLMNRPLRSE